MVNNLSSVSTAGSWQGNLCHTGTNQSVGPNISHRRHVRNYSQAIYHTGRADTFMACLHTILLILSSNGPFPIVDKSKVMLFSGARHVIISHSTEYLKSRHNSRPSTTNRRSTLTYVIIQFSHHRNSSPLHVLTIDFRILKTALGLLPTL